VHIGSGLAQYFLYISRFFIGVILYKQTNHIKILYKLICQFIFGKFNQPITFMINFRSSLIKLIIND
jgi:hypothetical protein